MTPVFKNPLPKSAYFRLLEFQKDAKLNSYSPDLPLVLFISFSRVAAGLSLISIFFPESILWVGIALGCMVLATMASIAHLSVPLRFITMIINSRSYLVWEIRLAGALTTFLAIEFLSFLVWIHPLQSYLPLVNAVLSVLFLISTGMAYRFESHPAWKSHLLGFYYLVSALTIGLGLRYIQFPFDGAPFLFAALLLMKGALLLSYRNHLKMTSPTSLKKIEVDKERWVFLAFLWTDLLLPALFTLSYLIKEDLLIFHCFFATSCFIAILLERVLFFWVERPVYFLSFIGNPEPGKENPYWIRG
jgi:DMSO reductase anchor subunit